MQLKEPIHEIRKKKEIKKREKQLSKKRCLSAQSHPFWPSRLYTQTGSLAVVCLSEIWTGMRTERPPTPHIPL